MSVFKGIASKGIAVWNFYYTGFRQMTVGRSLWIIILVKLVIIFGVLKIFFFPDTLGGDTPSEKSDTLRERLIERASSSSETINNPQKPINNE